MTDWHRDWLYALIFRKVEDSWNHFCKESINPKYWQYVLVEEWSSAEGARCAGDLRRAWIHDKKGLRKISLFAHSYIQRKIRGGIFPFVIVFFHIYPDKTHVVLCHQEADTAGGGIRYRVTGSGANATLEDDPSGGFSQS